MAQLRLFSLHERRYCALRDLGALVFDEVGKAQGFLFFWLLGAGRLG